MVMLIASAHGPVKGIIKESNIKTQLLRNRTKLHNYFTNNENVKKDQSMNVALLIRFHSYRLPYS